MYLGILRFKPQRNQILAATKKESKFALFKKTVFCSFKQRIAIGKRKKAIQADLGISTHIPTYSRTSLGLA